MISRKNLKAKDALSQTGRLTSRKTPVSVVGFFQLLLTHFPLPSLARVLLLACRLEEPEWRDPTHHPAACQVTRVCSAFNHPRRGCWDKQAIGLQLGHRSNIIFFCKGSRLVDPGNVSLGEDQIDYNPQSNGSRAESLWLVSVPSVANLSDSLPTTQVLCWVLGVVMLCMDRKAEEQKLYGTM